LLLLPLLAACAVLQVDTQQQSRGISSWMNKVRRTTNSQLRVQQDIDGPPLLAYLTV
jgi:hypothetical protein